jgi:hypothetical protein
VRRIALAVILVSLVAGMFVGRASADPRCCHHQKPPQTGSSGPGLPYTGLPLYLPVLLSLGLIGTGVVLRRRTREQV